MSAFRTADATVAAHGAVAVTKSDATVIPITRSLYIGTSGNVKVRTADGQTVTFVGAFGILPVQVDMVYSTDTTAADMLALY